MSVAGKLHFLHIVPNTLLKAAGIFGQDCVFSVDRKIFPAEFDRRKRTVQRKIMRIRFAGRSQVQLIGHCCRGKFIDNLR